MILNTLFLLFIIVITGFSGNICLVDLLDDLSYSLVYLFVGLDFLYRIDEEYVCPVGLEVVLLLAPAFSDPAFQEIALDGALEHLLRYGHHDSVVVASVSEEIDKAKSCHVSMTTLGK